MIRIAVFDNNDVNAIILDCMADRFDFQALIDLIAKRFNMEIAALTIDGHPLFRTEGFDLTDSRRFIRLSESDNNFLSPSEKEELPVGAIIYSDELPFGTVLVKYSDESLLPAASAIAESLAKVYQYSYNLREQEQIFPFANQILAHFLLSDTFMPNATNTALDELTDGSFSMVRSHPCYAVVEFRCASSDRTGLPSGAVSDISKYIPNSYCIKKENTLLSFLYSLDSKDARENKVVCSALDSFCRNFALNCAVSSVFSDFESRSSAVRQASLLISHFDHFKEKESIIFAAEHHKELILFGALQVSDPGIFSQSDIERLAEYDRMNGTEYLSTFESYLLSAGHFTKASKMLFLDRGTLKYRMNKIRELLSCDPDDPKTAERLLLAISIRKIINSSTKQ